MSFKPLIGQSLRDFFSINVVTHGFFFFGGVISFQSLNFFQYFYFETIFGWVWGWGGCFRSIMFSGFSISWKFLLLWKFQGFHWHQTWRTSPARIICAQHLKKGKCGYERRWAMRFTLHFASIKSIRKYIMMKRVLD